MYADINTCMYACPHGCMHVRLDADTDTWIQLATRVPADASGSVTLRMTLPAWTETETRSADNRQGSGWARRPCAMNREATPQ